MDERANEQTRSGQQYNSQRDFAPDQQLPESHRAGVTRGPLRDGSAEVKAMGCRGGQHAKQHARDERDGRGESQYAKIERHIRHRQEVFRQKVQEAAQRKVADTNSCRAAEQSQYERLNPE